MSRTYYSLITHHGEQVIAKAIANNTPVPLKTMAVGDGNGTPTTPQANQTALVREVYRAEITDLLHDPQDNQQVIAELLIPETVGNFTVREIGIFDEQNKLVAVANCPENYKPVLEQGSGKVQYYRIILRVSNNDAVTLSINNNIVYATRVELNRLTDNLAAPDGFKYIGACESVAQLRTIEPTTDQQRILLKSWHAGKNLGGGVFYADFADTTSADNGGTVIVTAGKKRWKRIAGELTPFDFGALGEGDDTAAFRLAVNFTLNLQDKEFRTSYLQNANLKNGTIALADSTALNNNVTLENVTLKGQAEPVQADFSNAEFNVNTTRKTMTLKLRSSAFKTGYPVLIRGEQLNANRFTEETATFAAHLAKGLWTVTSVRGNETILTREIKDKRELELTLSATISGTAEQCQNKVSAVKIRGSQISLENVCFSRAVSLESCANVTLNSWHLGSLVIINSVVGGEVHISQSTAHGLALYNTMARLPKSTIYGSATNGVIASQDSNLMFEHGVVIESGNSGIYAHTASTIEARFALSALNGKSGSTGSVGTGFESESGSTLFAEGAAAIVNDSYGFYANATSRLACANTFSYRNYHSYYALHADMFARGSSSINPRRRGYYAYMNSSISALDSFATGAEDFDYCAQGGSQINLTDYKNRDAKCSTRLNLNGANKLIDSNLFELGNYQKYNKGDTLTVSGNAITVVSDYHIVRGESGTTITKINGRLTDGSVVHLRNLSRDYPVTFSEQQGGNIILHNNEDCVLSDYKNRLTLIYDSAAKMWVELTRTTNRKQYLKNTGWTIRDGLIEQWGRVTMPSGHTQVTVEFPIAFNECFFALPFDMSSVGAIASLSVVEVTKNSVTFSATQNAGVFRYLARGV